MRLRHSAWQHWLLAIGRLLINQLLWKVKYAMYHTNSTPKIQGYSLFAIPGALYAEKHRNNSQLVCGWKTHRDHIYYLENLCTVYNSRHLSHGQLGLMVLPPGFFANFLWNSMYKGGRKFYFKKVTGMHYQTISVLLTYSIYVYFRDSTIKLTIRYR
jgi:hypothetical protein